MTKPTATELASALRKALADLAEVEVKGRHSFVFGRGLLQVQAVAEEIVKFDKPDKDKEPEVVEQEGEEIES